MRFFHRNDLVQRIDKNQKITTSYFQNKRWQLVTVFEKLAGGWPYQSKLQQLTLNLMHLTIWLSVILAMANKYIEFVGVDFDIVLEGFLAYVFVLSMLLKFLSVSIQQSNRRRTYETIVEHFKTITDPEETAILDEAAKQSFKYTFYYMSIMCGLAGIFVSICLLKSLYHSVATNGEIRLEIPVQMDFGFDHYKYWYVITVDFLLWICSGAIIAIAHDLSFVLQTRHVAALFEIVSIRLRKASELIVHEFENEDVSDEAADESYSLISSAIGLHSKCLDLVDTIQDCYSITWFLVLLLSVGMFGAGLHLISTKLHDPIELFRTFSGVMIFVVHFQVIFSRGQLIIDSAQRVSNACYNCKWYRMPKKNCKALSVMMMRSSVPCELTGAKLFPLNTETFGKMFKVGLSYYTLFES